MGVVGVDVFLGMWWQDAEKVVEFLEGDRQRSQSHSLFPHCVDDLVDDHGSGFEQPGYDGVSVVEDGSAQFIVFLAF